MEMTFIETCPDYLSASTDILFVSVIIVMLLVILVTWQVSDTCVARVSVSVGHQRMFSFREDCLHSFTVNEETLSNTCEMFLLKLN